MAGRSSFLTPGVPFALRQDEDLDQHLLGSGPQWVVVEFGARWAAACEAMRETFDGLAREHPQALFLRADVDRLPGSASKHGVLRVPSYAFFWCGEKEVDFAGCSERKLHETLLNCIELGPEISWRALGDSKAKALEKARTLAERHHHGGDDSQKERTAHERYAHSDDFKDHFEALAGQWGAKCRSPEEWEKRKAKKQHERELREASAREEQVKEQLANAERTQKELEAKARDEQREKEREAEKARQEAERQRRDNELLQLAMAEQAEQHRQALEEADRQRELLEWQRSQDRSKVELLRLAQESERAFFDKIRTVESRGNVVFDMGRGRITVASGKIRFKSRVFGTERRDEPVGAFDDIKAMRAALEDVAELIRLYNVGAEVVQVDRENNPGGRNDLAKQGWCRALAESKAELMRHTLQQVLRASQPRSPAAADSFSDDDEAQEDDEVVKGLTYSSRLSDQEETYVDLNVQAFRERLL